MHYPAKPGIVHIVLQRPVFRAVRHDPNYDSIEFIHGSTRNSYTTKGKEYHSVIIRAASRQSDLEIKKNIGISNRK